MYTLTGLNSNENRCFHWLIFLSGHSWTTPSLAGFAEQPAAWRCIRFGEGWMEHSAHFRVCHQRVQSLEQSLFCSQALHNHKSSTNNHNRKFKLYFKGDGNCLTADVCGMYTALWVPHSELCVCQYRYLCIHAWGESPDWVPVGPFMFVNTLMRKSMWHLVFNANWLRKI